MKYRNISDFTNDTYIISEKIPHKNCKTYKEVKGVEKAKKECSLDSQCKAVLIPQCYDGHNDIHLCSSYYESKNAGFCIYSKTSIVISNQLSYL